MFANGGGMVMCAYLLPVNSSQNIQRHINYTACCRYVKITDMKNRLKAVRCDNCKYFNHTDKPRYDGICMKDNTYTAEHRVCNKLPTDEDRRNAKLRRNG